MGKSFKRRKRSLQEYIFYFWNLFVCLELLEKNRHKRPSLQEVLDHSWFADFPDKQKN
jgi:hypothetical protein